MFLSLHMCIMMGSTSTIDLVFTCNDLVLQSCETVPPLSNSNYFGIILDINMKKHKQKVKCKGRRIWPYSFADWDGACESFKLFNWDSAMSNNIDEACSNWLLCFMSIMNQFIPTCFLRTSHNLLWLTKRIWLNRGIHYMRKLKWMVTS